MKIDISVYRGYVNEKELVLSGHVFKSWAPSQYSIQKRAFKHAFAIFKMFSIKPLKNIPVSLEFQGIKTTTKSLDDGYFSFRIPFTQKLESGWHNCSVICKANTYNIVTTGEILKPFDGMYGIISDIDDTFLISHSSNFFKKLYVMLMQNIDKRQVFEDVSEHYQALSLAGQDGHQLSNSFFYVSSSEWNLYPFIIAIANKYQLPKAVIKLKKIKTGIGDFLFTGRGNHDHKFNKIKDIISFYPLSQYILLGDDSQKDPYLYEQICKLFPENIKAVYIRQTGKHQKEAVTGILQNISSLKPETLYFTESKSAIAHSKRIGIID
ncbi:DUF2183 domain-containing protein [Subsaximicrobium wynnwilliamsii]|uniref:DUF2183 domain-containing protein n=1 Tax=Subsaximicrobium wynnwilliamsii TaxID=291179 RepID=A0A5C6ZIA9_9FLAO|nr:App1 family protein [Subsaximicrobium wynnwilliamsii]TXD81573.1 DUF2183 domain-containing protein [Subsaximicrobium wynnwilliamsii]TXD89935.1 DUF2183 domain-containing protein [Subsaximicrobium wynnwilliamsii]TXE01034.1 DUF2183 domain-containing protein [Subsaximicrobium wynnwilliamsii]